ncbi:MAG: restriction endonuclease subunit S [Thermoanaerobaculia bacterium]
MSVSLSTGVEIRDFSEERIQPKMSDFADYKIARRGHIVFNKMRMWQGAVGVAPVDGFVSPDYTVLEPSSGVEAAYFSALFRTPGYTCEVNRYSHGIALDRNRIYWDGFKNIVSPVPPLEEQRAISSFIDRKTAAIDALIAKKERQVETLRERLHTTVCSFLSNADGPITKLGYVVDLLPGYAFPSDGFLHGSDGVRLLRGVNVSVETLRWDDSVRWPEEDTRSYDRYRLATGDVVLGMDRPWIGAGMRVAEVREKDLPALLLQRVARLRAGQRLKQGYLLLLLASDDFRSYFEPILTGVSVPHISPEQVKGFRFRLPSPIRQDEVLDECQKLASDTSRLSRLIERQVLALREYRQALISAAVTGKIDIPAEEAA